MLKLMMHLRFSHLLRLVGPWGGETWFCCEEEQRSSYHWTQTPGRLPAEGASTVRLHTCCTHMYTVSSPGCLLAGGCRLILGRKLLAGWRGRVSKRCLCFSLWVSEMEMLEDLSQNSLFDLLPSQSCFLSTGSLLADTPNWPNITAC